MPSVPSITHSRDNAIHFFTQFAADSANELVGKIVVDLSAGSGYIASLFEKAGAQVMPFDLFPDQNQFSGAKSLKIDLQKPYPIGDSSADLVIFSETIEHLPNQLFLFQQVARILKPSGRLILTTPNTSSLRSRFAQFMMESEHYSYPAPNELDAFVQWPNGDSYFGKLFLSGILRLRTLAALNNLQLKKIHKSQASSTSIFLLILYPLIIFFNRKIRSKQIRGTPEGRKIFNEIYSVNTSLKVLIGKHLIIEFDKK